MTCANQDINGVTRDGGYGEFVTLRTEAMMAVPADMDPALAAPLVCAGITVFNSLRNMDIHTGDVVGVQGIGGLGESLRHTAVEWGLTRRCRSPRTSIC